MTAKRVTLLGGTGFLGSAIAERLLTHNYNVTVASHTPLSAYDGQARFVTAHVDDYADLAGEIDHISSTRSEGWSRSPQAYCSTTRISGSRSVRDYIYIDDVAESVVAAVLGGPTLANIGTGIGTSLLEIRTMLEHVSSWPIAIGAKELETSMSSRSCWTPPRSASRPVDPQLHCIGVLSSPGSAS